MKIRFQIDADIEADEIIKIMQEQFRQEQEAEEKRRIKFDSAIGPPMGRDFFQNSPKNKDKKDEK